MEKTWTIDGGYGTWSMTVKLEPDDTSADPVPPWHLDDFDSVGSHFQALVESRELGLYLEYQS